MKVVQLCKIYNFHFGCNSLGQKIWNYFEIRQFFLNAKEHNLSFKIARVALSINISFYDGKSEKQVMHFNPSQNLKFCLIQNYFVESTLHFFKITKIPLL